MNEYRHLEIKFKNKIKEHFNKVIPNFLNELSVVKLSNTEEDTKFSFDIRFEMNMQISVRIRKNKYKTKKDLTIRSKNKGYKTELDKIMEGKGQFYFYAYMTKDENNLEEIYICDVKAIRNLYKKNIFNKERDNGDGTALIGFYFKNIEEESKKNNYLYYKFLKKFENQIKFQYEN